MSARRLLPVRCSRKRMDHPISAAALVYPVHRPACGAVTKRGHAVQHPVRSNDRIPRGIFAVTTASEMMQNLEARSILVNLEERAEVRDATNVSCAKQDPIGIQSQTGLWPRPVCREEAF